MQSVCDELVFEEVPALLNRVELWPGGGKPFHLNSFSVGFQPSLDFLVPVGFGPVEE